MTSARRALVLGATGFIGRWLLLELDRLGIPAVAAVRTPESGTRLLDWLRTRGADEGVETVPVDFGADDLGLDPGGLADVTEVHNAAGAYRFGMTAEEAREANVVGARRVVGLAARLPQRPRLVHVSGYRVGGQDALLTAAEARAAYRRLGAYEASKVEADAVVQHSARELGVPFTIVNPATVSGVSATGESDQQPGLASSLHDLWRGALPALPGNDRTFVPVVPVDHLARFMALVAGVDEAAGKSYWVLDDRTPALPDLLRTVGRHYQVGVPRARVPVPLLRALPRRITRADPETLSFLDDARYPVREAEELAARHGLDLPETVPSLLRWADHLAAHRFGQVDPGRVARSFAEYGGRHTFVLGDPEAATVVLPALPVNADTWEQVAGAGTEPLRVLDLPGLGMSAGDDADWPRWLDDVVGDRTDLHLVGHSVGAALAVEYAAARPDRVRRLTLVAPAFLQPGPGLVQRVRPLTAAYLRTASAARLARTLMGEEGYAERLRSSVLDLRRPGVARRVARLIARGADPTRRDRLRTLLATYPGTVHLVVGEHDPLAPGTVAGDAVTVTTIRGAGHYPQLSHPDELVRALAAPAGSALR